VFCCDRQEAGNPASAKQEHPDSKEKLTMQKKYYIPTIAALFVSAVAVYAANVHLIGEPSVTDNGNTLTVCATLAGLGNQNITVTLTTKGEATATCVNPGGNTSPGINKVPITSTVTQTIRSSQIKNGTVSFCSTTEDPGIVSSRAAGCPNNNWLAKVTDVEFTSATLTVVQGGRVVLRETF
jgi:hypothetical protein